MKIRGGRPDMRLLRAERIRSAGPAPLSSVRADHDRGRRVGLAFDLARVVSVVGLVAQKRANDLAAAGENQAGRRIVRRDLDSQKQKLGEDRRELFPLR